MIASRTTATPLTLEGRGLHTGEHCRVTLRPAKNATGRTFYRHGAALPALVDFVVDTRRCVTLGHGGETVRTVEHLLAACMLAEIDHLDIDVDGSELPALDGAATEWLAALRSAGVCTTETEVVYRTVCTPDWFCHENSAFFLTPANELVLYAALSIPDTIVDHMIAGGPITEPTTAEQLARARTYGLEREVQALLAAGLGQGGSLENAVILSADGYLNAEVWPNEPAWHKVLDLLGDLALTGSRLSGHIVAVGGGHRSHVAFAHYLRNNLP